MRFTRTLARRAAASGRRIFDQLTRRAFSTLIVGIALLPGIALAGAIEITDETNTTVHFAEPVDRIVIFNTANGEYVRAVAPETIIGIDGGAMSDPGYWPETLPIVGANQREPNYEAIIGLEPDVVIFPINGAWEEARDTLSAFDIPVLVFTGWDPLQREAIVTKTGLMTGREDQAETLNAWFDELYARLESSLANVGDHRRVFVEHGADWRAPIPGSGWHDMIIAGGGDSILSDIDIADQPSSRGSVHAFEIDPEVVLAANPEVIIKFRDRAYLGQPPEVVTAHYGALLDRPGWTDLTAVKNDELHTVNWFVMNTAGKVIGSLYIAKWLYPDAFSDVNPDEVARVFLEDFQGVPFPENGYAYSPNSAD